MVLNNLNLVLAEVQPITENVNAPLDWIYTSNIINFILVIAFLAWVFRKYNVLSVISDRQNTISQKISNAEEDKARSETELTAVKEKAEKLDGEVQGIINEANGIAESLSGRIKNEITVGIEEIHKKSQKSLEIEKQVASNEVLKDISRVAFVIAEGHIKQAIDEKLHKKYIDEFIDNLDDLKV